MPGPIDSISNGPDPTPNSTGFGWKAAAGHALGSAGPAAVGLAAGIPVAEGVTAASIPFAGPFAPVVGGIAGLVAGGVAGYGAQRGQDALLNQAPGLQRTLMQDPETRAQQERDFPKSSMVGEALPNLAAFRPTLSALNPLSLGGYLSKSVTGAEKVAGIVNAGVGGASELAQQMNSDDPVDLTKVALATGLGALGQRETTIGTKLAGLGRMAIPASMRARLDAHNAGPAANNADINEAAIPGAGLAANDGTQDVGAAGGAGAPADTSATNLALSADLSQGQPSAAVTPTETPTPAATLGAPAAPSALPVENAAPPAPAAPTDPNAPTPPAPAGPVAPAAPNITSKTFVLGPDGKLVDQTQLPGATPPAALPPPDATPPPASSAPPPPDATPPAPAPRDPVADAVSANFSSMQVLRTLRDFGGNADTAAVPDEYMLKLANGISTRINPADPDGHAVHGYLEDQLRTLIAQDDQLKEHVITNQVKKTNTPEQVKEQVQTAKDLDAAQKATSRQIKTLGAAQDAMPTLISQLKGHVNSAHAAVVAPAFQDALTRAKARIAAGDTVGQRIGEPDAPATGTVEQMKTRNVAAVAQESRDAVAAATAHSDSVVAGNQALHAAKVRDDILNSVLDDPTTLNPMERFRAALVKSKIKDLSLTEAEGTKIARWEGLREALHPPHTEWSPNEMDPNLVPEAKPKPAEPAAPPDRRQAAATEEAPQRRAADTTPEWQPPEEPPAPTPEAQAASARSQEISSLGDVVKAAGKQGAIDKGTQLRLMHELTKPEPNLDMVRTTVAKGAKRLEAITAGQEKSKADAAARASAARDAAQQATHADTQAQAPAASDAADLFPGRFPGNREGVAPANEPTGSSAGLPHASNAPPPHGMAKADVQSAVDEHLQGWAGAPKVVVHQNASTLPEHLQGSKESAGVYDPASKTVHLIARNIVDKSDAHATLFHEALGHYGLRKVFGDRLTKVLSDIYHTNPEVQRQAAQWLKENYKHGSKYDAMTSPQLQRRATEEVLARASEPGPQKYSAGLKGAVERVKSFVRDVAQRIGIKKNYSNEDVTNILRRAHDTVIKGGPTGPKRNPVLGTEVPLDRAASSGIGGDLKQRVENLMRPDVMKANAKDEWVSLSGAWRRGIMKFQDLGWLTESADKLFTVGGVDGEHLLPKWRGIQNSKGADKTAAVEKSRGPHDLYVALPPGSQAKVKQLLLQASDAAIEVRTPRTAEGDAPALEAGLRKQYEALTKPEKAAHDGMRGEFSDQLSELRKLLKGRISEDFNPAEGDTPEQLKQKGADKKIAHDAIDEKLKELPGYFPMARFGDFTVVSESPQWGPANDKLDALRKKAAGAAKDDLPAIKEAIKAQQATVDKMQPDHYEVSSFESEGKQKRHADEQRAKGWDVREKLASNFDASVDGVAGSFMKGIMDRLDARADLHPDQKEGINGLKSMINQLYLQQMPASSAMKRQMMRKGVAGYSTDIPRVYAAISQRNAGFLNEIKYGMKSSDLLAKMSEVAENSKTMRAKEIYNHLKSMFDLSKEYAHNPITKFMENASYAYYLGGSASFSIMHMMQTPMVTWGMLFGSHGGLRSAAALTQAAKEVMGGYKTFMHDGAEELAGKTAGERNSIRLAAQHNLIAGTHTSGFLHAAAGPAGPVTQLGRGIMALAGMAPHHVERANRLLTNLAAYRLAISNPEMMKGVHDKSSEHYISDRTHKDFIADHMEFDPKFKAFVKKNPNMENADAQAAFAKANPDRIMTKEQLMAARYAEQITGDSHVDYAASSSPKILQQMSKIPVLGWSTQFQKYQFGMLKVLGQNAGKILDRTGDITESEKRVARRTLAGVLGMHGAITGMMGLPGAGLAVLAANLYHKAFGDPNDPFDAETSFRKTLAGLFGKDAGDVAARGLLYAPGINKVAPADITDRLGMGDLGNFFNATRLGEKINSDSLMSYIGTQITGPVGSIFGNMADGARFAHEGDYQRAMEEVIPKVLRDVSKAQRYATAGIVTGTGMPVVPANQVSTADWITQVLGFTPQVSREAYAQRQAMSGAKSELEDRRNVIIKEMLRGRANGNTSDARAEMDAFNAEMREKGLRNQVLNMGTVMKAVQERLVAMRRLQGGTSVSPRDRALRDAFGDYSAVTDAAQEPN
jgi:hypothetical protein